MDSRFNSANYGSGGVLFSLPQELISLVVTALVETFVSDAVLFTAQQESSSGQISKGPGPGTRRYK